MPCLAPPRPITGAFSHTSKDETYHCDPIQKVSRCSFQRGIAAFGCLGSFMECKGRTFWHDTSLEMFSGGSKGREGVESERLDRE